MFMIELVLMMVMMLIFNEVAATIVH